MRNFMKKRIWVILFALILAFACVACNGNGDDVGEGNGNTDQPSSENATSGDLPSSEERKDQLVIFENGAYTVRIICPDQPNDAEKYLYSKVREKLQSITGVRPEYVTDFIAAGDAGVSREGPAILIGNTNFEESKQVYDELGYGEGALKVVGDKLVMAFASSVDADNMYVQLLGFLRGATDNYVGIRKDIDIVRVSDKILSSLPKYTASTSEVLDCDNQTYMLYVDKAEQKNFEDYRETVLAAGYEQKDAKKIGNNFYETFIMEEKYLYLAYREYDKSLRIVTGPKNTLGESDCTEDREEICTATLTTLGQPGGIDCGQVYIVRMPDGRFLIQDGGHRAKDKPDYIYNALVELAPDPEDIVIAAWFISHPHSDHQYGYEEFLKNHGADEEITLQRVIINYAPSEMYTYKRDDGAKENNGKLVDNMYSLLATNSPDTLLIKAHTGQIFDFGGAQVEILYTVEDYLPVEKFDYVNSTSLVIRVNICEQSMLFLADTTHLSGRIIEKTFGDYLKSDMVQLAHHGMAPSNKSLYQAIQADVLLWPSTYRHAAERYQAYKGVIDVALSYAEDVYVSDADVRTVELPYVIQNNKDEEMANLK
jgi:beta-lactamase superfamily II metal-dependent hydrolase